MNLTKKEENNFKVNPIPTKPNIMTRKSQAKVTGLGIMAKPVSIPESAEKQPPMPYQFASVMKSSKPVEPIYTIGGIREPKRSEPVNHFQQDINIETHHFATAQPSKPMMLVNKLGKSRTRFHINKPPEG